jgi:hypothetical protein
MNSVEEAGEGDDEEGDEDGGENILVVKREKESICDRCVDDSGELGAKRDVGPSGRYLLLCTFRVSQ